jgi:hypothetical protein
MGEMGHVLAECVDEVTMDKYNYGMVTFEPIYDICDYRTSRPKNQEFVLNGGSETYLPIRCFSYA